MNARLTESRTAASVTGLVVLTAYARADLAVSSRILQVCTVQRFAVERLVADFSRFDHGEVKGIESVREPLMRISIAVSLSGGDAELARIVKHLDRIVDVVKVERTVVL